MYLAQRSIALRFYRIEQGSECRIRDLDIRHLYGSQGRSRELRDLIVIESSYRQIPRNVQAEFERPPHYTDCRHVIRALRSLPDFELDQEVDEILYPYVNKIAEFVATKVMLSVQNPEMFEEWRKDWKDEITTMAQGAGPRNEADAEFVEDFLG